MHRREFLKTLGLAPLALGVPDVMFAAAPVRGGYTNLLVLIELKGGNDGLNTVIPYADPRYVSLRPRLAIARDQVVQLDERTALHPSLKPLHAWWQQGELAIVQGVGYPEPNLSHFRSIEIWETASTSTEYLNEGWLTRLLRAQPVPREFAADGVVVGSQDLGPLAGGARAIALNDPGQFQRQARLADDAMATPHNAALAHIMKVEGDIRQAASGLKGNFAFRTEFPRNRFGNAVKSACQVIAAERQVAVVRITHNGFDTHSNQLKLHARLLTELAEGMQALRAALTELGRWDSTLVMTYAEFGRRAQENGSGGTDHGTAAAHWFAGGRIRGGLYGAAPDLGALENNNLRYEVDFRSLYATVIEKWWGFPSAPALGRSYPLLPVIRSA